MLVGTYRAAQAGPMLYAAVPSPNTAFGGAVAAIDGGTLTVTTTIPIAQASGQPYALAVSSDGQYVYSLNSKCNGPPFPPPVVPGTVSVISTATNTVMATVTVGTCPQAIAVSPDGKRLYVAHNASAAGVPAGVEVLDTSTPAAATAITDFVESSTVVTANGSLGAVRSMALAPDGRHLYVAWDDNGAQAGVDVVDSTTGAIVATMSLGTTFRRRRMRWMSSRANNTGRAPRCLVAQT
jgi:YVTN family beta-propeller protein